MTDAMLACACWVGLLVGWSMTRCNDICETNTVVSKSLWTLSESILLNTQRTYHDEMNREKNILSHKCTDTKASGH